MKLENDQVLTALRLYLRDAVEQLRGGALGVAEALAGNTIFQLHRTGSAFVFSCGIANLDMRTSTRAGGGPEHGLTSAAFAQMAHHYGFPALVGGFVTTSKEPDQQAAYETVFGGTPRIVLASLVAHFCGEFCNSYVLAKMKVFTDGRHLWTRTIGSTIVGEAVDSMVFYPFAFLGAPGWTQAQVLQVMAENLSPWR